MKAKRPGSLKPSTRETARVVWLPGDGVGPEVVREARRVVERAAELAGLELESREYPCGGRYWLQTGKEWPDEAFPACRDWADAVLLGAVGWPGATLPNGDLAGGGVLFGLRFGLDLYANVRPAKLFPGIPHRVCGAFRVVWPPESVDMVLIRENTEGCYAPVHGQLTRGGTSEVAVDSRIITRKGAERVIRHAFELARERQGAPGDGKRRVTCIDKANVMAGCRLFRGVFDEVALAYPDIATEHIYVDAFMQALVRQPEHFDVGVTTNMMGDIATDLAAVLQGGMGVAPSGEIGDRHAMFEGVHGSAPDIAGKGIANPLAAILSGAMMLDWIGCRKGSAAWRGAGAAIETAVRAMVAAGEGLSPDIGGTEGTSAVGDAVLRRLAGEARRASSSSARRPRRRRA
ncbi:MAG: isocitrate/isopropylmalate dehydrogenase family protein [Candidatus Wallbacteria bacterium]|nr:isocitrate/isopropylmalate dehydrogenase family protein [Candidatus Wallbacteria bacterium]